MVSARLGPARGGLAPNSNALFEFTTDGKGKLLSVELLESSSDGAWFALIWKA